MLILKSKLLKNEIKHWMALAALCAWAISASLWGYAKKEKVILIAIEGGQARLVTDSKDNVLENELTSFIKNFLEAYYQYDSHTFSVRVGKATDLMSESLWKEKQSELAKIQENLKGKYLTQKIEIQSIDRLEETKYEIQLKIFIQDRMTRHEVSLKVLMSIVAHERSSKNPYPYEIESLDEVQM